MHFPKPSSGLNPTFVSNEISSINENSQTPVFSQAVTGITVGDTNRISPSTFIGYKNSAPPGDTVTTAGGPLDRELDGSFLQYYTVVSNEAEVTDFRVEQISGDSLSFGAAQLNVWHPITGTVQNFGLNSSVAVNSGQVDAKTCQLRVRFRYTTGEVLSRNVTMNCTHVDIA